jgi:hypothetical protein
MTIEVFGGGRRSRFATKLRAGTYVRFGSKADICSAKGHVRFTPNSDRKSRPPQNAMSALPLKADMCSALAHVRFGPIADIGDGQRYLTISLTTFSHCGHSKVRLSWPGSSGSIRASHILAPHCRQIGCESTRRAGSKNSRATWLIPSL